MDTYIEITWKVKKEKFLFCNGLIARFFDQCTSCTAELKNSSIKWKDLVVNPQKHMHQAVRTINKKSINM
jgi:hypothetical protein